MKCIFQLLHLENGERSSPIEKTREEFATLISTQLTPEQLAYTAVLVLMEQPDPEQEYKFSAAPYLTADSFINYFGVQANA